MGERAAQIVVNPEYIHGLGDRCDVIAGDLRVLLFAGGGLQRAPKIKEAVDQFADDWKMSRADIADGLENLARVFNGIAKSFSQADQTLGASLDEEEP